MGLFLIRVGLSILPLLCCRVDYRRYAKVRRLKCGGVGLSVGCRPRWWLWGLVTQ